MKRRPTVAARHAGDELPSVHGGSPPAPPPDWGVQRMRGGAATVFAVSLLASPAVLACTTCRPAVQAGIFDEHFWGRLALTVLPFLVILLVVAALYRVQSRARPGEEPLG